jgi:hypothetical protein
MVQVTSQSDRPRIDGNTDLILEVNANFESTYELLGGDICHPSF